MNGYEVAFARSARRELEKLPSAAVARILPAIRDLSANPRPNGSRKLGGEQATYRIRVGDYRVIYEVDDATRQVLVTRVRHRKDAYQ